MDDNLYDEFGNYIGPELGSDDDSERVRGAPWRGRGRMGACGFGDRPRVAVAGRAVGSPSRRVDV